MWHTAQAGRSANQRVLHRLEQRLDGLSRTVHASRVAPANMDRVSDTVAGVLNDMADKFRERANTASRDVAQLSDDALEFGNDALRKLTREVEHRPLMMLAIAVGVGALAAAILTRRS